MPGSTNLNLKSQKKLLLLIKVLTSFPSMMMRIVRILKRKLSEKNLRSNTENKELLAVPTIPFILVPDQLRSQNPQKMMFLLLS